MLIALTSFAGPAWSQSELEAEAPPLVPATQRAEASPEPVAPTIVPPRLVETPDVPYPAEAQGDAVVLMTLLVDATGKVAAVEVLAGGPHFNEAAVQAARGFRFEPATQNGVARAARISFELRFTEPEPVIEAAPPDAPPSTDAPDPSGKPAPIEVEVLGERKPVGARSLSKAEVRQLPGAFGDPFRAIEALPGVTPIVSGVPFFYVRGAPPGNVGYMLDGIRVPFLYHVGLGPSVIHPGLVRSVDLYPGAYPARYGRFGGGIVAGLSEEPPTELGGEWQLRLFDAGALVETPLDDGRGSVSFAGRYSYTAYLISLFAEEDVRLEYWDYQLRGSYDLTPRDTISVFSFGSFDYFGEDSDSSEDEFLGTEFHRVDVRYAHRFDDRAELHSALTLGYDRTRGEEEAAVLNPSLALRSAYTTQLTPSLGLEIGLDARVDDYRVQLPPEDDDRESVATFSPPPALDTAPGAPPVPPGNDITLSPEEQARQEETLRRLEEEERSDREEAELQFPTRTDAAVAAYVEAHFRPTQRIALTPSLRFDFFSSDGAHAFSVDPRISAEFRVGEHWTLTHTLGLAHQPPSFVIPIPGFQMGGLRGGLQRSVQHSAGVIRSLPDDMRVSATVFHNQFYRLSDLLSLVRTEDAEDIGLDTRVRGRSYGFELLFRRDLSRKLGGFLSYTYSRSERFTPTAHILSAFDRPHVLSLALAYDLGSQWRAGGRLAYYSGTPADVPDGSDAPVPFDEDAFFDPEEQPQIVVAEAAELPARLPSFHRIDLRVEKRWNIGDRGAFWSLVLEMQNVTLNTEVVGYTCSVDARAASSGELVLTERCREEAIGPVTIPSLGIEGRF